MGSFGWLIAVITWGGMTLLCVILSVVRDIRDGFSKYDDDKLVLKTKRLTVYPLIYMAVLTSFWHMLGFVEFPTNFEILLGLIIIFGFIVAITVLFPMSIYGLILAIALKKRKINKYAGSTYIVCGILSIPVCLPIISVIIIFIFQFFQHTF
ncbi:MAG: hypothetical protein IJD37_02195 [Clostridia bacterium]|nr:hypothetical protein [Clostridia bacterium]